MELQSLWALVAVVLVRVETSVSAAVSVVHTPLGDIRGRSLSKIGRNLNEYLGVPFALPPTGRRRFRPPEPIVRYQTEVPAFYKSEACPQGKDLTFGKFKGSDMWNYQNNMSEDCLKMNIWAPVVSNHEKLPVLVWLFGGGFWYGSPSLDLYDGATLAATGNVIVAAVNYRIGAFGFLYLNHSEVPGNMGMLDQQMALKWMKTCIGAFNGDPGKITLFGESAGAASIVAHMLAPSSFDLWGDGVLQSGSLDNNWSMDLPERALAKSWQIVQNTGCARPSQTPGSADMSSVIECLRALNESVLINAIWSAGDAPVQLKYLEFPLVMVSQDKNFFTAGDAFTSLRDGPIKPDTNLIAGINRDEGMFWNIYGITNMSTYWASRFAPEFSQSKFEDVIVQTMGSHSLTVQHAAAHTYWDTNCTKQPLFYMQQANQMVGDYHFSCDTIWLSERVVSAGVGNVWFYYFSQESRMNPWPLWTGVMHGYEIGFVFGEPRSAAVEYPQIEKILSTEMMKMWAAFATNRDPNLNGIDWPKLKVGADASWLELKGPQPTAIPRKKFHECQMWRDVRDIEYKLFFEQCGAQSISPALTKHCTLTDTPYPFLIATLALIVW